MFQLDESAVTMFGLPKPSKDDVIRRLIKLKAANTVISLDISPPPLVEDPDRFYRSGEN
jgi:hypothetical protein